MVTLSSIFENIVNEMRDMEGHDVSCFLTPVHKGFGYSRPLHRPGSGGHKACGCSTALTPAQIFTKFSGDAYPKRI